MGLLVDIARTTVAHLRERAEEVTARALLKEALVKLNAAADPHWRVSSIEEVPGMIAELALDRDDYRAMAQAYREDLLKAEAKIRELEVGAPTGGDA